ncbi:hypothetical protein AMTR_s00127p00114720 [Amborella trichopoda]|uniref:Uncharacterized protein n=1 Tax=Amborella trichopoda TaxID=13333 RepID=W1NNS2_AMBTC|nr:hypothetical protein AMTR_s00127p00114720 [Amborella trichopoda]
MVRWEKTAAGGEEGDDGEEERLRAGKGMRLRWAAEIGGGGGERGGDGWLQAGGDGNWWWWMGTADGGNGAGESRWWQQWVRERKGVAKNREKESGKLGENGERGFEGAWPVNTASRWTCGSMTGSGGRAVMGDGEVECGQQGHGRSLTLPPVCW